MKNSATFKLTGFSLLRRFLQTVMLITAVLGGDPYACKGSKALVLKCTSSPGLVVTGFIYGGHISQQKLSKPSSLMYFSVGKCSPDADSVCQAPSGSGRVLDSISRCVWKRPTCNIPIMGQLAGNCFQKQVHYMIAKKFKCVKKSRIIHMCENPAVDVVLTSDGDYSEIYLLSKGYPEPVAPRLNCNVTIISLTGKMQFTSFHMNIHPKAEKTDYCDVDYLEFENVNDPNSKRRFCGKNMVYFNGTSQVQVRFVSGKKRKHYEGFVIYGSSMAVTING